MTAVDAPGPDVTGRERGRAAGLAHDLTVGAVRDFVWSDLRDGVLRVADLDRTTRTLARVGLVLMLGMVVVLLAGDAMRGVVPLVSSDGAPIGRGEQVPTLLFPLMLFMMSVAWAFLLTGAARSHWVLRSLVSLFYAAMALQWVDAAGAAHTPAYARTMYGILAVTLVVVALWRRIDAHLGIAFGLLLVLVGLSFLLPQARAVESFQASGIPIHVTSLGLFVQNTQGVILPLLLVVGIEIAAFLQRSSGWVVAIADTRLPPVAVPALLVVVGLWRLWSVVGNELARVDEQPLAEVARSHLGAAGAVLLTFVVWRLVTHRRADAGLDDGLTDPDEVWEEAEAATLPAALGYLVIPVTVTIATVLALGINGLLPIGSVELRVRITEAALSLTDLIDYSLWFRTGLYVVLGVAAIVLARRGRTAVAIFLGTVAALGLWARATDQGSIAGWLYWDDASYVNDLWTLVTLGVAAVWVARGRLTSVRQHAVLGILLVTAMLAPAELIGDPFSPFFASAGIAFIAFGIVWDLTTAGSWANEGTDRLPRSSRIFLYLGYVLFSVSILCWAVVSHNLDDVARLTGDVAANGFTVFGRPLLYATFALLLAGTVVQATDGPEADEEAVPAV